ncbi:MAG: polyamine aminopropyltransferase [Candidatus Acidulodesulfobacterium acidiphilum]|jgi:spermidine synthase|uniref:Polyamine aminopropyltransferase n=1 Tax=Candidatus Acidulodesulfobacterium acidiphilum TaxID=2597224 RepID=A0A520XB79_9DELT|nr:MAG: polyamine aminopropyltransferase [Candidatus Acidulodesulfobacterium acidiphilum]
METWFFENQTGNFGIKIRVESILFHEFSDYQEIAVYDTLEFGRVLVLDKAVMFSDKNEFVYHEMLGLVPLFSHKKPERILIIGGGDGGVVRECLKNPFVKHIDLVEIDKKVIDVSKKFFPEIACKLDDKRVRILAEDGIAFVKRVNSGGREDEKYDVILIDSTDPVGPAEGLFRRDFYEAASGSLKTDGIFAAQTESPFFNKNLIKDVGKIIREIYEKSSLYLASIPVYPSGLWSFTAGSKKYDTKVINESYDNFDFAGLETDLKYYSREIHSASFILPNFIKEILK